MGAQNAQKCDAFYYASTGTVVIAPLSVARFPSALICPPAGGVPSGRLGA
jgi:hypothetical protein